MSISSKNLGCNVRLKRSAWLGNLTLFYFYVRSVTLKCVDIFVSNDVFSVFSHYRYLVRLLRVVQVYITVVWSQLALWKWRLWPHRSSILICMFKVIVDKNWTVLHVFFLVIETIFSLFLTQLLLSCWKQVVFDVLRTSLILSLVMFNQRTTLTAL